MLVYFWYSQLEPTLSIKLSEYKLSQTAIGLYYGIFPIVYIVSGLSTRFIPHWMNKASLLNIA